MITIPYDCPRGLKNCISLAKIESDGGESFFCCGENDGSNRSVEQDKYTTCFKGPHRDEMSHSDKRDLVHQAAVLSIALAVVEKDDKDHPDWSPYNHKWYEE